MSSSTKRINWEDRLGRVRIPSNCTATVAEKLHLLYVTRGMTTYSIGTMLDMSPSTVRTKLIEVGVPIRRSGWSKRAEHDRKKRLDSLLSKYKGKTQHEKFMAVYKECDGSFYKLMKRGFTDNDIRNFFTIARMTELFNYKEWVDNKLEGIDRRWVATAEGQAWIKRMICYGHFVPPTNNSEPEGVEVYGSNNL